MAACALGMERSSAVDEQMQKLRAMQLQQLQTGVANDVTHANVTQSNMTTDSGLMVSGSNTSGPIAISGLDTLNMMYSPEQIVLKTGINYSPSSHAHTDNMDTGTAVPYTEPKKLRRVGNCKVCGDEASGMYFGAMVCVPCKTFFLRYYGDNFSFVCRNQKDCEINMKTRTQCKYCRMQKCLQVGMLRRVRPSQVQISDGQQLCVVCSDLANGLHFGAITCEGCKKFFRRGLKEHPSYVCKNEKNCLINPRTRNACRFCRYQKCLKAGMCREAIQMGRPSKFRHIVHNPHLPIPKLEPQSPESLHHPSSSHPMAMETMGRDPRDMHYAAQQAMYNPHMAMVSPQATNQLYQALKGNPRGMAPQLQPPRGMPPEMHSPRGMQQEMSSPRGMPREMQSPNHQMVQVKSEPPDYGYNQISPPPGGYHSPIPQTISPMAGTETDHVNILNITSPWSQAMKTMNQECNMVISNTLMSDHDPRFPSQYPLKYSTAGATVTETTRSMTTSLASVTSQGKSPMPGTPTTVQSTFSSMSQPQMHAIETNAFTNEDIELLENLHKALETAQERGSYDTSVTAPVTVNTAEQLSPKTKTTTADSSLSPSTGAQQTTNPFGESESAAVIEKSVIINILKSVIPTVTTHTPYAVASESIDSFNNFMELSTKQLTEWVEFLKKERESSISPNNGTLKAIQKNTQQFDPNYWLNPALPDENIFFTERHRQILDQVTSSYTTFVETGHTINMELTFDFYKWLRDEGYSSPEDSALVEVDDRFNSKVVEKYTVCSVNYCKGLPGFRTFSEEDQYNIVRLGQSQSRILAAACHWYRRDKHDFDYFLAWKPSNAVREYKFKESCLKFSEMIAHQDWDMIESAIMNSLVMVATDFRNLKQAEIIENTRRMILQAFRAYTTAKYGTPNSRIEELFSSIPRLRELGVLHHKWTMVHLINQESKEAAVSSPITNPDFPQTFTTSPRDPLQVQLQSQGQAEGRMTSSVSPVGL